MAWIRTCQECGNKQDTSPPPIKWLPRELRYETKTISERWLNAKCTKCKSMALDYGKDDTPSDDSNWAE